MATSEALYLLVQAQALPSKGCFKREWSPRCKELTERRNYLCDDGNMDFL
jgi:hypothetical protein